MTAATTPAERQLKPAEAGAILGVSAKTIYRYVYAGRLRAIGIGLGKRAHVRIPESALAEFAERTAL